MRQRRLRLYQVLPSQELIAANSLNFPLKFVHKHMGHLAAASLTPSKDRDREYRRHLSLTPMGKSLMPISQSENRRWTARTWISSNRSRQETASGLPGSAPPKGGSRGSGRTPGSYTGRCLRERKSRVSREG
ncbi:hypothetical protein Nepgr_008223 [Nepenthes gracilis]|uniref:Uncharacterized protein n=1 Tax=Nepenthes gracilis TaxID=150966 RepID=A0AAD3S8K6_NEPGR|nr:hypothetical protein Nepgr_008223 [Nepenthes gracilis]